VWLSFFSLWLYTLRNTRFEGEKKLPLVNKRRRSVLNVFYYWIYLTTIECISQLFNHTYNIICGFALKFSVKRSITILYRSSCPYPNCYIVKYELINLRAENKKNKRNKRVNKIVEKRWVSQITNLTLKSPRPILSPFTQSMTWWWRPWQ